MVPIACRPALWVPPPMPGPLHPHPPTHHPQMPPAFLCTVQLHRSPTPPARRPPWPPPATSCAWSAASSAARGGTTSARGRPARWAPAGHAAVFPLLLARRHHCLSAHPTVGSLPFHTSPPCSALQDVACAECPLHGSEEALGGNPAALFCVFDGHCGRGAADAASVALPDAVSTRLKGVPAAETAAHSSLARPLVGSRRSACPRTLLAVLLFTRLPPMHPFSSLTQPPSLPCLPACLPHCRRARGAAGCCGGGGHAAQGLPGHRRNHQCRGGVHRHRGADVAGRLGRRVPPGAGLAGGGLLGA